jgi:sigma-70-like protein
MAYETSAEKRARDREIWRLRRDEKLSHAALAERFELSEQRIKQIITRENHALYNLPKPEQRADLTTQLEETLALLMEVVRRDGAPVTAAGRDGVEYVRDPESGEWAKDFSGRVAASQAAIKAVERLAKMHGIDAPAETLSEQHITYELKGEGVSPDDI